MRRPLRLTLVALTGLLACSASAENQQAPPESEPEPELAMVAWRSPMPEGVLQCNSDMVMTVSFDVRLTPEAIAEVKVSLNGQSFPAEMVGERRRLGADGGTRVVTEIPTCFALLQEGDNTWEVVVEDTAQHTYPTSARVTYDTRLPEVRALGECAFEVSDAVGVPETALLAFGYEPATQHHLPLAVSRADGPPEARRQTFHLDEEACAAARFFVAEDAAGNDRWFEAAGSPPTLRESTFQAIRERFPPPPRQSPPSTHELPQVPNVPKQAGTGNCDYKAKLVVPFVYDPDAPPGTPLAYNTLLAKATQLEDALESEMSKSLPLINQQMPKYLKPITGLYALPFSVALAANAPPVQDPDGSITLKYHHSWKVPAMYSTHLDAEGKVTFRYAKDVAPPNTALGLAHNSDEEFIVGVDTIGTTDSGGGWQPASAWGVAYLKNGQIAIALTASFVDSTIAHEIGHSLGLDHATYFLNLMYSTTGPWMSIGLTEEQILAMHYHLCGSPEAGIFEIASGQFGKNLDSKWPLTMVCANGLLDDTEECELGTPNGPGGLCLGWDSDLKVATPATWGKNSKCVGCQCVEEGDTDNFAPGDTPGGTAAASKPEEDREGATTGGSSEPPKTGATSGTGGQQTCHSDEDCAEDEECTAPGDGTPGVCQEKDKPKPDGLKQCDPPECTIDAECSSLSPGAWSPGKCLLGCCVKLAPH